jgi:hypothetical protein
MVARVHVALALRLKLKLVDTPRVAAEMKDNFYIA